MNRDDVALEVWCRRVGRIQEQYAEIGIPTVVEPTMPRFSALPKISRSAWAYSQFLRSWIKAGQFRERLAGALKNRFDALHLNHEALFPLLRVARRVGVPATIHVRTRLKPNAFSRYQNRTIARDAAHIVFITENERETFEQMAFPKTHSVIRNIVQPIRNVLPHPDLTDDPRFKVLSLSNYDAIRGTDRVIEIAKALKARGRQDIVFVMAGDMAVRGRVPAPMSHAIRRGQSLQDYAEARGVEDMFVFLGHVSPPEPILAASHALIKPTRESNPWGRDIIEACAAALPVLSVGTDTTFVETDKTGFLPPRFEADIFADYLIRLASDRSLATQLGAAGQARVAQL